MDKVNQLIDLAASVGVDRELGAEAGLQLASGKNYYISFSGKLASGKDTVAQKVMEKLAGDNVEHLFLSKALRLELDLMLDRAREMPDMLSLTESLIEEFAVGSHHAEELGTILLSVPDLIETSAWSRTDEIRKALQYLGTDIRRTQDENYWVKKWMREAFIKMAEGYSLYSTDCRFPNEIEGMHKSGFKVVRLLVTKETQAKRLAGRDGLLPNLDALEHESETALDKYNNFDLVVDNNQDLESTVRDIVDSLRTA